MISILEGETFIFIWIGFLLLMSCGIGVFFFWGIRNDQFQDQDRARYLPLQSGIPADKPNPNRNPDNTEAGAVEKRAPDEGTSPLDDTLDFTRTGDGDASEETGSRHDSGGPA
jgi:cbb3-type cytochrome oxidase maturation protein